MRTFITFEFNNEVKKAIYEVQNVIKQNSIKGRFKYIDNFHLTLKFLGDVDENKIKLIYQDILRKINGYSKFKISLNGIDCFGRGDVIKTIYIKCKDENNEIIQIANIIDGITSNYGFKSEKRFTPHVTVAQDVNLEISFEDLIKQLKDFKINDIVLDRVTIMKSEQIQGKRVYTPIYVIPLK